MRQIAIGLAFLASFPVAGQVENQSLLSWYDGWGTHTVWGGGKVTGGL